MDVRVGLWRKLSTEELILLNCGVGEDSWESLGLQGDPTSLFWRRSWVFIGRTNAEAETPILWPPDVKSWLIGKDCDAGRDWGQEEKGTTEDEMAGWHHRLDGEEFVWTPGDGDGQEGLVSCWNSWGHKELDTTERLNWTDLNTHYKTRNILFSLINDLNLLQQFLSVSSGLFRLRFPLYMTKTWYFHSLWEEWKGYSVFLLFLLAECIFGYW